MLHLNPIQYPKLVRRNIFLKNFLDLDKINPASYPMPRELEFSFTGDSNCRVFYGKKLQFILNNTVYIGTYRVRESINGIQHYLYYENGFANYNQLIGQDAIVLETFYINDDTQALTYQDVMERLNSEQKDAEFDINKITHYGTPGLLDGIGAVKLKEIPYEFKYATNVYITNYYTTVANVKLEDNKLNKFKIFLHGLNSASSDGVRGNLLNIEICVDGQGSYYYIKNNSHFAQWYNLSAEEKRYTEDQSLVNDYELKLTTTNYKDGTCNLIVSIRLSKVGTEILSGYFACCNNKDTWQNDAEILSQNNILQLNGKDTVILNSSLLFADKYGEQRTFTLGDTPTQAIPIQIANPKMYLICDLPIGYYKTSSFENQPADAPGQSNDANTNHTQQTSNAYNGGDIIKFNNNQFMYITDTGRLFIGRRQAADKIYWDEVSVDGHQHPTSDIKQDEEHRFVSDEQIEKWDKFCEMLDDFSWISYGTDKNDEKYKKKVGNVVLKDNQGDYASNPILYANLGTGSLQYVPLSIGALTVESQKVFKPWETGTLIKQSTINEIGKLGMGVRIPIPGTNVNYPNQTYRQQYVLIDNNVDWYTANNQNDVFFDLVKRTGITTVGKNSVNIGILNYAAKNEVILYGTGLLNEYENQVILGHWNSKLTKDIKLVFGVGTNDSNRKNAIWYRETIDGGFLHINGVKNSDGTTNGGKIMLEGYDPGMVLINGEDPVINDFAHMRDIEKLQKQIDELTTIEVNIIGYEELMTEDKGYQYVQNKPLTHLPLTLRLLNVGTVGANASGFDDSTFKVMAVDSIDIAATDEDEISVENVITMNGSNWTVEYIYAKSILKKFIIIWNKKTNTGKRFELAKMYVPDNATFMVDVDWNATINADKGITGNVKYIPNAN